MKESEIQKAILDYLGLVDDRLGKDFMFWRNNTGAMSGENKGKRWFMRFGDVGSPDIFVLRAGKFYGIEVKSLTGIQSEEQKAWQARFEKHGGVYLLVRSVDEVMEVF